jgi:hypothetical protein
VERPIEKLVQRDIITEIYMERPVDKYVEINV